MTSRKKLKAGIIGFGYMGKIRKRVIDDNPDLDFCAVYDVDKKRILSEAVPLKRCKIHDSYQDFLNAKLDVVFVCTPNMHSPGIVCDFLKKGVHVFCEKPPGRNIEDINMVIKAERSNPSAKLMFGFNHRYHPGILEARGLAESGRFGRILFLKGTYGKSGGAHYLKSWRNLREVAGGGILLDQGIHMLDLFRYFCGDFEEVKSMILRMFWEADVEDNAFVTLKNSRGQAAMLHSSATLWKHCFKLEIFLEKGYLIVSGLLSKTGSYGREMLTIGKRQFEDESFALGNPREEVVYFDQDRSWDIEVEKFVEYIRNNAKVESGSSLDALKAMELVYKAYEDGNV